METIRTLREQLDGRRDERRIAIVGTGLRAAGGITDRRTYWDSLTDGRDLTGELPEQRRRAFPEGWDGLLSRGGYLDDVLGFDAKFFGISPREAKNLDPQHRLLLEVVWEAFEDAAILPARAAESTGVFVGITGQDYRQWAEGEPSSSWLIGNGHCFAAGRIAYTLGFQGPTMAIDTACSSSLVAVHTAARALVAGDCDVAVAGGVNLVLAPRSTAEIARTEALSPDGRCRPFDARANGFVRGEGCGAVVLKRLSDARKDGDRILAVIEGTGVNQDGRSSGFTAPNVLAQSRLIESVLAGAGLTAADIGYLEAHGTGTPLGDPIELEAARMALGRTGQRWHVGSVKANLGHTESAAGVLGLIKAVLCLERRRIPRQAQFETLNPRIDLGDSGMTVPTETVPWEASSGRCAAVSSFGMSGTNAHVVLSADTGTGTDAAPRTGPDGGQLPDRAEADGFLVSAHTLPALRVLAARWADEVADHPYPAFAHTATYGRTRLRHAVWIGADTTDDARAALSALAKGDDDPRVRTLDAGETPPQGKGTGRAVVSLPAYPWERITYSVRPV
ncbi:beta-ketoacyl synthase N-terminal-like domain-containing protein [Streptomyces sp. NPDC008125]|uniref:beta-ketoacyl synthase N-terminal-like domain-containing protein n=1 Tax=Streptomyces sp. NPDC008125 TaxID=3364811 RepID=UPI0036EFF205